MSQSYETLRAGRMHISAEVMTFTSTKPMMDALTTPATYDIGLSSWFCGRKSGAKREFGQGFAA